MNQEGSGAAPREPPMLVRHFSRAAVCFIRKLDQISRKSLLPGSRGVLYSDASNRERPTAVLTVVI